MEIKFGIQDAPHRSKPVSAQTMVNCYLEAPLPGSKSAALVVSSYGISQFSGLTNIKGAYTVNGVLYVQTSTGFYSVNSSGTATLLASLSTTQPAIIEGDGISILVMTAGKAYLWDGSTLTAIADPDFPNASWMGYVDGYFPVIEEGTGKFWINETPFLPAIWNPLDFKTAAGNADDLLWGIVDKKELIMFGRETTEIFYNSGNADFPFDAVSGGFIETGIMSKYAAEKIGSGVFFMGHDGIAYMMAGYVPTPISNQAFAQAVDGYTKDCRCFAWYEAAHPMVAFKFPEACWVYDLSTQLWHNRKSYSSNTWDVTGITYGHGQYLTSGATVGKLVPDVFTEYGNIMRAQCTSAAVASQNQLLPHDLIELLFETGNEGTVMLRFSDDGGRTWSTERTATLGDTGKYKHRVRFNRLGSSRDRVYEYAISDANRRTLIAATLNEWG